MKKLLTSFAAFTALTAAATAADLPRRAAPPVFVPVPVFTWTGFYAGFNAGYGFGVQDNRAPTFVATADPAVVGGPVPAAATSLAAGTGNTGVFAFNNNAQQDGFTGGAQIGYNYQFTPGSGIVVGVEADAQYADLGRRRDNCAAAFGSFVGGAPVAGSFTGVVPCNTQATATVAGLRPGVTVFNPTGLGGLDFFGTVRGRLGYAFDRVLFYGTGGFAYGSFGGGRAANLDDFRTGYAVGGGVEYALPTDSFLNFFRSSAVTLKIEGLYVNFDGQNRNAFANAGGNIITATPTGGNNGLSFAATPARRDNDFAVVRAGLNYKFGSY